MHKRLVTRYAMNSADDADENQRRVEAVFDELETNRPTTVSYRQEVRRVCDDQEDPVSLRSAAAVGPPRVSETPRAQYSVHS